MALVEIDNLSRHFGKVRAAENVSFSFDAGAIYGFIGPNGAGKTTTMRILATLDTPTSGDARVGGHSVIDYPDKVRHLVGFLPDYYGTYANMDIVDYLDFFARAYGLKGAHLRSTVRHVIEFTGMEGILEKPVNTLSKGMKQRLALGRVLVHDPQVLVMDEPTAGLDPRARIEFRELVKLLAGQGKAVLISSHILTELAEMIDACAIIEKGRILCQGSVEEVRKIAAGTDGAKGVLRIEFLDPQPEAEKLLREQPFVREVRGTERSFTVQFEGDPKAAAGLLKLFVDRGMLVTGFHAAGSNLEDVFMAVTKGEVQ